MRNNVNGFTLIEIIVSLAIFALISVSFLTMFSTVFISTYRTSEITEETFMVQKLLENEILDIKSKLENDLHAEITTTPADYVIFDSLGSNYTRTVTAYPVNFALANGQIIESLVSQIRPPQLIVPVINSPVVITANTTVQVAYPNIGMKQLLTINGQTPSNISNPGYLIHMLNYWYRTSAKHYTPYLPPTFPDDFEVITQYTDKVIPVITDDYSGKFVQLMMTPVGEKGQVGQSVPSNAILVSSMPVNSNLLLHMDASFIDTNSSTEVISSLSRVRQWKNISLTSMTAVTTNNNNSSPEFVIEELGVQNPRRVISIQKNTTNSSQTLANTSTITGKQNLTMYFAVRFYGNAEGTVSGVAPNVVLFNINSQNNTNKAIIQTDSDGILEVRRIGNNTSTTRVAKIGHEFRTGQWAVFKVDLLSSRTALYSSLEVDADGVYHFVNSSVNNTSITQNININRFLANFAFGYNVGEVMIFDGEQSQLDSQAILKYLYEKFMIE